jgi:hypothetical protein
MLGKDSNENPIYDFNPITGLERHVKFDDIYPTVSNILANTYDVADMMNVIYNKAKQSDWTFIQLYNDMQADGNFASQIFNTMRQVKVSALYANINTISGALSLKDARKDSNPIYKLGDEYRGIIENNINTVLNNKEDNRDVIKSISNFETKYNELQDTLTKHIADSNISGIATTITKQLDMLDMGGNQMGYWQSHGFH